jgi:hypothetical protein
MVACQGRVFNVNGFGTFPINMSCDATRTCTPGGTIRPSLTATGQVFVGTFGASLNSPLSGSQNILNWACAGNNLISGNPTVSLSGQMQGDATLVTFTMNQTGQIIVGNTPCSVNIRTTGATPNAGVDTTGSICDIAINLTNVTLP